MNGIVKEKAIFSLNPAADYSTKLGYFVLVSAGTATITTSASTHPFGVILDGGVGSSDKISVGACAGGGSLGTVRAKLAASLGGIVVQGTNLIITTAGTLDYDPGSGARVQCAQAMEAGVADEIIEVSLFKPVSLS